MKATSSTRIVSQRSRPPPPSARSSSNFQRRSAGTPSEEDDVPSVSTKPKLKIVRRNRQQEVATTTSSDLLYDTEPRESLEAAKSSYSAGNNDDDDDDNYYGNSKEFSAEDMKRLEESSARVFAAYNNNNNNNSYKYNSDDIGRSKEISDAIVRESLDCIACMCPVRIDDQIWQCSECFLIMHLVCLQRWAKSSAARPEVFSSEFFPDIVPTWKCPKCRKPYTLAECPTESRCFCGKVVDPPVDLWRAPHSCGQVCGKALQPPCGHTCLLLCHPGPCPPCPYEVDATCFCGKVAQRRRCADKEFSCGKVCGKQLGCGVHTCRRKCHDGECGQCEVRVRRKCACGKAEKEVVCGSGAWHCDQPCGKMLACGRHACEAVCHEGECPPCKLRGMRTCFCGKKSLGFLECDVPTRSCGDMCNKVMPCGHRCPEVCHSGECPPCVVLTKKKCRCKRSTKEMKCCDIYICDKKCQRTRNCGKHKCGVRCCPGNCPPCSQPCDTLLNCGNHTCPLTCHSGPCGKCPLTQRVSCTCGAEYVDVPCGEERRTPIPVCTRPCIIPPFCSHPSRAPHNCHPGPCPPCTQPCGAVHEDCGHPCIFPCHTEEPPECRQNKKKHKAFVPEPCPPCATIVERSCLGKHEVRKVECHTPKLFSCSRLCGNPLRCGRHFCTQPCHTIKYRRVVTGKNTVSRVDENGNQIPEDEPSDDDDDSDNECDICTRKCELPRPRGCTHKCLIGRCHPGECPKCTRSVRRRCHCSSVNLFLECWQLSLPQEELDVILCCKQPCKKDLPFCRHYCKAICHKGPCPAPEQCIERVTVKCKCKTRSEVWECSKAQEARKALKVKDTGYLVLLECNEECRARKEADDIAKKEREDQERAQLRRQQREEERAANQLTKRTRKRGAKVAESALKDAKQQTGMSKYAKLSVGVALVVFFIALVIYVVTNTY